MKRMPIVIILGVILLTSSLGLNAATAITTSTNRTTIGLDNLPLYSVTQGQVEVFSGQLLEASSLEGVVNATVKIVQQISYNNQKVLVTGVTDADGLYSIPWVVDVAKIAPVTGGSFGLEPTQGRENRYQVEVFAQYDGDDEHNRSVSNSQSFEVRLNQMKIELDRKAMYLAFESAKIRLLVTDVNNNPIDVDTITTFFNNNIVTVVRDNLGVYSFTISSLSPGQHTIKAVADKIGYITDEQLVTIEAVKRKTGLVINTDKKTYGIEETVNITVELLDTSANELVPGKPVAASLTSPDLKVTTLTFIENKATYKITKADSLGRWTISASFAGDEAYFGAAGSGSFDVEKEIVVVRGDRVSLGAVSFADQQGMSLSRGSVGEQVMIQAKVTSNFKTSEDIAYISQVKDADGITVALSWITGTISPGQSLELAISWLPDEPGEYTAEVFVWKSVQIPEPLTSDVKRSSIVVR